MEEFSIPETMDPIARVENQGRNPVNSDRRRRQPPNPPQPSAHDNDLELPADEENKSHDLDELA